MNGLNGFASLRTRPNIPMSPELCRPICRCSECGAVLSRYNLTHSCAVHSGVHDIPEWAIAIIECDDRMATVDAVAAQLSGQGRGTFHRRRAQEIRAGYASGLTKAELAREFGLTWDHVNDIVTDATRGHHKRGQPCELATCTNR